MKPTQDLYRHPYVIVRSDHVYSTRKIASGKNIGMITGITRPFDHNLFLSPGCFYLHSEKILDARYTGNPLAWVTDGFFDDCEANIILVALENEHGYIYGLDVIATKDIPEDHPIVYHTLLPL